MDSTEQADQNLIAADSLSCKICRRRKVKCDKKHPCNNCLKSNAECVFPRGRRRPTQTRPTRDAELLSRLKYLETELHTLRTNVISRPGDAPNQDVSPATSEKTPPDQTSDLAIDNDSNGPDVDSVTADFGRLDIRKGRSRYTSNALWASLSQEIADMQELLDEETWKEDRPSPSPFVFPSGPWPSHSSGLLLGLASNDYNTAMLHPTKAQMHTLWSCFERNVLPVVKIFHGPTTKVLYETAATGVEPISPEIEPALFSIYYAAVVSLNTDQCQSLLGESRQRLIRRYRQALEQSLCHIDFHNSSTFAVLQAFLLFTICTRRHDDTRVTVSWCATAIRIAQLLGLHRDGSNFGLDPFQTEMRRRVWWHLMLLDSGTSRDHGIDPLLQECSYDTRMPLNINEEDIYPELQSMPLERQGFTDMTNAIARFETSIVFRRLSYAAPGKDFAHGSRELKTVNDKEQLIKELQTRLDEKYLQYCDYSKPLQFATAVYIRSACTMLWSIIYHPLQRQAGSLSEDMHDRLFASMVEVIENTRLLEVNPVTAHWGWYFHNDVQWTAIAYVLNELLTRPPGPSVSSAWRTMYVARRQWDADSSPLQKGMLWRAVRTMTAKAGLFDSEHKTSATNNLTSGNVSDIIQPLSGSNHGVSLSSLVHNVERGNPSPTAGAAVPNVITSTNHQLLEDPWLVLEDEYVPIPPVVTTFAPYDFDMRPTTATSELIPMSSESAQQRSANGHQNTWWSLLNQRDGPQWIA